jgi:hypothetical protein
MNTDVTHDATIDEAMQERSSIETLRDSANRITGYRFSILVHDKPTLSGEMTREEVEKMYRLYSQEGASLTQRTIVREFPNYTFPQFKKILRAFNITKSSAPLAPHTLEELTTEEAVEIALQNKENDFFKKLEQERGKRTEQRLKEITKEYQTFKEKANDFEAFFASLDITAHIEAIRPQENADKVIVVYLSDMHIGADVSRYSIFANEYNAKEVKKRLNKVLQSVLQLAQMTGATDIIVCNIGDSLDGYDAQTTRGGHNLPQNMDNKDQLKNFVQLMVDFFGSLANSGYFMSIKYYCVEGGNHDGDFGYAANFALQSYLRSAGIEAVIFDQYIDHFKYGKHTFVLCHGKDAKDVFKNMPLVLSKGVENQIDEYLDYHSLKGNIHFVKGDLHQSATTYGKRFRYKSVASLFGSSAWIHKNFGNTKAAVDIDIIDGDKILETRVILN